MKVISVVIISVLAIFLSVGAVAVVLWHDRIMRNKQEGQMVFRENAVEFPGPLSTMSTIAEVLNEAVQNLSTAQPTTDATDD